MKEYEHFSWGDFERAILFLKSKIMSKYAPEKVYGIPRGGLIIAVVMSHRFNIPLILDPTMIDDKTLVVDDISDSGDTLSRYAKTAMLTVTIHIVNGTATMPTFHYKTRIKDWVVYPWERNELRDLLNFD